MLEYVLRSRSTGVSLESHRRLTSTSPLNPTNSPTHLEDDSSMDVGMITLWVVLGMAFAGLIFMFRRCRRRAYMGFEKLDPNAPEESDDEQTTLELSAPRTKTIGATMLDIREEEQKLVKRVESARFDADEEDPLFGRMPESTKPPTISSRSDEILSRSEVILNSTSVPQRDVNHSSFDVGDASSSGVSSVSEDSMVDTTPPPKKRSVERLRYPDD